jgi:hypothetical protein
MTKEVDIVKALYPKTKIGVLKSDKEGSLTSVIIDAELDDIKCRFDNDNCVELDTDEYSFIALSVGNLYQLIELIEKSEKRYKKRYKSKGL